MDFSRAQGDRIDLSPWDANTGVNGDQAFMLVGSESQAKAAPGRIYVEQGLIGVTVWLNTDGDRDFEGAVRVVGVGSLQSSDFLL